MQLNSDQIQEIIPHRYPFLLIDRVDEIEPGVSAKGIKCVTANENFFCGHFPKKHIMPGVLILEALAQLGAVAILSEPENKGKLAVFGGVDKCRFKAQVVPGDVLELESTVTRRRGPLGFASVHASVGGKTAVRAEISFAIVENKE